MPFEFNRTVSGKDLASLGCSAEGFTDTGFTKFWQFVRSAMTVGRNSAIVFKQNMDKSNGGFLTEDAGLEFVCMPKEYLTETGLKFESSSSMATLVHELCHWLHMNYFNRKFNGKSPLAGRVVPEKFSTDMDILYYTEYEAWLLSRLFGKVYHFSSELLEQIDLVNRRNLTFVLLDHRLIPDFQYRKYIDKDGKEVPNPVLDGSDSSGITEETGGFEESPYASLDMEDFILDEHCRFRTEVLNGRLD